MENPLLELQEYDNLVQALKSGKGPLQVTGTLDSQKVHLMYELGEASAFSWKLVVTYDDTRAKEIYDDLRSFTILAGLPAGCGCILPRTCCFTARTFMET